jgi:hypothetical protein
MQQEGASSTSIIALVLGILSFFGPGCLTGIPAWIVGRNELKKIDAGESPAAGRTMAQIGMILGMVTTALTGLAVLFGIVWVVFLGALFSSGAVSR